MRKCDMKSFWLVAVVVVNVLSVLMVGAEECETEILGMKIECTYYMTKSDPRILDPNPQCCKAIADAHKKLSCWCNSLARKVGVFPLFLSFSLSVYLSFLILVVITMLFHH
ncbi:unnamed protein product [Sphenostylis stenocarpa]|uniref:Bifunctional inhibitor/plant lipid transfer protein/seed storage helical domain-containing protein n=1 Tax=Sphenostylis stenocarpa TaxID=92480 RepID=A0AA86SH43_9FABA|nr:unnamed protein product [Sphenostylis stenocarpa]